MRYVEINEAVNALGAEIPGVRIHPERQWEHAYPGTTDQVRRVRAALREYLGDCPVAADAAHLLSELSANAIVHSDSGNSGGTFTVRAHHFRNSYVWGEVEDQGSDWDGDLPRSAMHPHGLYFLQLLASAFGVEKIGRGRVVWFRIDYPLAGPTRGAAVNGGHHQW
jgi:serine/threonine-protein kinase RsbW